MTTQGFHRWKEFHPVDMNCSHRRKSDKIIIRMISKLKSLYQFSVMQTWVWHDFGANTPLLVPHLCEHTAGSARTWHGCLCLRSAWGCSVYSTSASEIQKPACVKLFQKNDSTGEIRKYLRISSSGRSWATPCPHWHPASSHQQS